MTLGMRPAAFTQHIQVDVNLCLRLGRGSHPLPNLAEGAPASYPDRP